MGRRKSVGGFWNGHHQADIASTLSVESQAEPLGSKPRGRPPRHAKSPPTGTDRVVQHPPAPQDDNGLKDFSGDPHDWIDWQKITEATVGKSAYAEFLTNPPNQDNVTKVLRNKEFFNTLAKATQLGVAKRLIDKQRTMATEHGKPLSRGLEIPDLLRRYLNRVGR